MLRRLLLLCLAVSLAAGTWPILAGRGADQASTKPRDVHFYFAQITDTHLDGQGFHTRRTQKVVEAVNRLPVKVACVVHTGDIVMDRIGDESVRKTALSVLGRLRPRVHFIAGNHDILGRQDLIVPTAAAYRQAFGPLCTRAEYHGVVFLFVYTEASAKGFRVEGVDALAWLTRALKAARGKPVIVFHHTPSVRDFHSNRFHRGWPEDVRHRWVRLLNAHNVKAVIAGHFHRDEHHWLGNVPLYVCSSVAGYWGRQATFRLYEYRNGKVGYRTVYIED